MMEREAFFINYIILNPLERDIDSEREKDGVVYVILCDWDSKDRVKW